MILIIGAGMAGVTLARYLQSHAVPFRIFDQQDRFKNQNFGLTLCSDTTARLLPLLKVEEHDFGARMAVDRKTGKTNTFLVNLATGERLSVASFEEGVSARDLRTNWERLRGVIMGDVEGMVEYGCKLQSFVSSGFGVRAEFENGMVVEGSVLAAANGVHSLIRSRLLPHRVPQDWDGVMLNGTCRIPLAEGDA